jgi:hypothetical protein
MSVTEKNAMFISASYDIQKMNLNRFTENSYPLSCHFVKRAFGHQFGELYFFNPKAEEFKRWTAKFLDHGLFEFWRRVNSHHATLNLYKQSFENRLKRYNSSSIEALDISNLLEMSISSYFTSLFQH